jgi:hypothetical protein
MKKLFLLFITCHLLLVTCFAQELNCSVSINAPKNQNIDPQVFKNMETAIREFLNGRKWTNDNYKDQEQLWQQSETVTLNVAFKPIVNIQVKLNNGKNYSLKSSSNRIILYDDSDIDFECKYKSNPVDSVQVIWKLDDINQNDFNDKNVFNWLKRTNRFDLYSSISVATSLKSSR